VINVDKKEYKKYIRNVAEMEILVEDVLGILRKDIDREKEKIRGRKDED